MTTADINPDFITTSPVSKQEMRNNLTNIKNSLLALEAAGGWKRLSYHYLSVVAPSIVLPLPAGFIRYRIEFQDLRPDGGATTGVVQLRASLNGGTTWLVGTSDYTATSHEFNNSGATYFEHGAGTTVIPLTGLLNGSNFGSHGYLDLVAQCNRGQHMITYLTTGGVRNTRQGAFNITGGPVTAMQLLIDGGVDNFAVGGAVSVLAR